MRIQIRPAKLHKYFPPHDTLALKVAQLCIFREDHFLELRGITADSAGTVDAEFPEWRSLYFLRKSARTIHEIRKAIEGIRRLAEYKKMIAEASKAERKRIEVLTVKLNDEYELVKQLGDSIGAHVLHEHLENTLNSLDASWEGFIQVGEIAGKVSYKFAGELVLAMMLPNVPEADRRAKLVSILKRMASKTSVIELIDLIFALYHRRRRLS